MGRNLQWGCHDVTHVVALGAKVGLTLVAHKETDNAGAPVPDAFSIRVLMDNDTGRTSSITVLVCVWMRLNMAMKMEWSEVGGHSWTLIVLRRERLSSERLESKERWEHRVRSSSGSVGSR